MIRIARFKIASDSRFGSRDFAHLSGCLIMSDRSKSYRNLRLKVPGGHHLRGTQPSSRISEEICFSKGFLEASVSEGSAGQCGGPQDLPGVLSVVTPCLFGLPQMGV